MKAATKDLKVIKEAMTLFEANISKVVYTTNFDKEKESLWLDFGVFYCSGIVNDMFNAFLLAYTLLKKEK